MKNTLILFLLLAVASCSNDDDSSSCNQRFDHLVGEQWFPPEEDSDWLAVIRFDAQGKYFENGEYDGDWEFNDNCDILHLLVAETGGNEFEYEIYELTSDTFKVKGPFGAIITYRR